VIVLNGVPKGFDWPTGENVPLVKTLAKRFKVFWSIRDGKGDKSRGWCCHVVS
jgi:hypothetical protein